MVIDHEGEARSGLEILVGHSLTCLTDDGLPGLARVRILLILSRLKEQTYLGT